MANIYCENYNCKNYFEDMCMLERIEINNFKECESYLEGKNELYELENEYTIHVKDLNSAEVTCITNGLTVKSNSSNSILRLELEDLN